MRRPFSPRLAVALVVGAVVAATLARVVGAGGDAPAAPGGAPAPAGSRYAPPSCDALLVLSGSEQGLLKPCGCSRPQRGGLPRRAALIEALRAGAAPVAAISVGATLSRGPSPTQNDLKAELFRASLDAMGYAGALLGPEDLAPLGGALVQAYATPAGTPRPPLNVKIRANGPQAPLARVDPVLRFALGDLRVRAVSVVDPTTQGELVHELGVADAVVPPGMGVDALPKEPGLLVVAAHTFREDLAVIAQRAATKADLVVVVDVLGEAARRTGERARPYAGPVLVTFDARGQQVAVVALTRRDGAWTVAWDAVALDPVYDDGASPARDAVGALFRVYRENVRAAGLVAAIPTVADVGPGYAGDAACVACHAAIHDQWAATPHARALATLVAQGYDADPECLGCHVVGWGRDGGGRWSRTTSGFAGREATPARGNVQCEACHGPAAAHVRAPDDRALLGPARTPGKVWKSPGRTTCAGCHDVENSHGFHAAQGLETYLRAVDHHEVPAAERTTWTAPPPGR